MDDLKDLLKLLNLDYPIDEETKNGKESTVPTLSNKDLVQHIEFVLRLAGDNGIELDLVREDWEKLMKDSRI